MNEAISTVKTYLLQLQNQICAMLEHEDNHAHFHEDAWSHAQGGGGLTRVLTSTAVLEKAGVNFSHVHGASLPTAATAKRSELANAAFQALGVSTVVHPLNPFAPTSHFNIRFIVVTHADGRQTWWFGGGFDLTPYYGFEADCIHWHTMAKAACAPFGDDVYDTYKKWCDDYFFFKTS